MKWRKRDNCNKKRTIDRRCTRFEEAAICLVSPLQLHPRSSRKGVEDSRASRDGFQKRLVSRAIATGPILTGMISVFERSWNLYLSPEHHPEIVLVVLSGDEEGDASKSRRACNGNISLDRLDRRPTPLIDRVLLVHDLIRFNVYFSANGFFLSGGQIRK